MKERLQVLFDRLKIANNISELETITLLKTSLAIPSIPWGICGLILAIYHRTMQRGLQNYEEGQEIYDSIVAALGDESEKDIDIPAILENPDKLEQIGKQIFGSQPGLLERVEKQVWEMVTDFESNLVRGDVDLNLFTEEELLLPLQHLQTEFGDLFTQDQPWTQPSNELRERVFETIRQAIADMMTMERFLRFREDVKSVTKNWFATRNKWAAALQFEQGFLNEQYEENKFILAAFIGQLKRLNKET